MGVINVEWPSARLSEQQWRDRVEGLAERAEAMVGQPCTVQDQGRLAIEFAGLLWPTLSAEVIALSARASLVVGAPGVLMAPAPTHQLLEIQDRLWELLDAAQADPAAAVVEGPALLVELPPLLSAAAAPPEPVPPGPAPEPSPALVVEPSPEPEPPPPSPAPAPPNWLLTSEAAEVLGVSVATVSNWRQRGRFGAEGQGWVIAGHTAWHSPEAVEQLEAGEVPPGLDQLISDVQAA